MNKTRILFIHGGGNDGYGDDSKLADSLRHNLDKTFEVIFPHMPTPDFDSTDSWTKKIHEYIATYQPTILAGHSFGASNILQYLVRYGMPKGVKGIFLMALPFWGGPGWDYEEYELPSNFADKLSRKTPLFLYQCRDDEVVDIAHLDLYATAMPWATVRRLDHGDHQIGNDLSAVARDIVATK